jgi:glycosyltransferase involved in cell wall biosynthesis
MTGETREPVIVHVDAESDFSGGEVQVFLLIEGLRRAGWRCVLACPPGSRSEARADELDIECTSIAMRNELDGVAVAALSRMFQRTGASLAHLHTGRATWLGGWAARIAGIPAITTRRMDREIKPDLRTRIVYGTLTRRAVAISPQVAECLRRGGVSERRIRTISSAVDPATLRVTKPREQVRRELGANPGQAVLLSVGALVQRKGIDVLLAALAQPQIVRANCVAWIAGDGEESEMLQLRARESGIADNVKFLGRRDDVADLLAGSDVFVMPSRREGLGVAALEAMAAGRAIVATNVGGLGEAVVHERTGLLVPPDDARALAVAIARVIYNPALREHLGHEGPSRVSEGYLASQMVDAYIALYREVLAEVAR